MNNIVKSVVFAAVVLFAACSGDLTKDAGELV